MNIFGSSMAGPAMFAAEVLRRLFPDADWSTPEKMVRNFLPPDVKLEDLQKIPDTLQHFVHAIQRLESRLASIEAKLEIDFHGRTERESRYTSHANRGGESTYPAITAGNELGTSGSCNGERTAESAGTTGR